MLTTDPDYCPECLNLGFILINSDDDDNREEVQACDCGKFETDEDAAKALVEFIRKHAPKARRATGKPVSIGRTPGAGIQNEE